MTALEVALELWLALTVSPMAKLMRHAHTPATALLQVRGLVGRHSLLKPERMLHCAVSSMCQQNHLLQLPWSACLPLLQASVFSYNQHICPCTKLLFHPLHPTLHPRRSLALKPLLCGASSWTDSWRRLMSLLLCRRTGSTWQWHAGSWPLWSAWCRSVCLASKGPIGVPRSHRCQVCCSQPARRFAHDGAWHSRALPCCRCDQMQMLAVVLLCVRLVLLMR